MKIFLIGPVYPYRGGIAHQTTQLKITLDRLGHAATVISYHRQFPKFLYKGVSDKDPSNHPEKVEADFILDPLFPSTWKATIKLIIEATPDIVIMQWWTTFWAIPYRFIADALNKRGITTTYLIHNVLPHEKKIWDLWLAKTALMHGKSFITQSPDESKRLIEIIPRAKIYESKLPVYRMFSKGGLEREQSRNLLRLPGDEIVLLSFGIVRAYKGVKNVINALGMLKKRGYAPHYLIVGEFWEDEKSYHALAAAQGVSEQVHIINRYVPDDEVKIYFSAADALIAVYVAGTQSAVVTVGLDFKLLILTTPKISAGIDPVYADQVVQIPPGDVHAIAEALTTLYQQPKKLKSKINEAPPDWERFIGMIEKIVIEAHTDPTITGDARNS